MAKAGYVELAGTQHLMSGYESGTGSGNWKVPDGFSIFQMRHRIPLVHCVALREPERLTDDEFADEITELLVRYLVK